MPPVSSIQEYIKKIIMWSTIAKRKGILGLENILASEENKFAKKGLSLLIDRGDAKSLRAVLNVDLDKNLCPIVGWE